MGEPFSPEWLLENARTEVALGRPVPAEVIDLAEELFADIGAECARREAAEERERELTEDNDDVLCRAHEAEDNLLTVRAALRDVLSLVTKAADDLDGKDRWSEADLTELVERLRHAEQVAADALQKGG